MALVFGATSTKKTVMVGTTMYPLKTLLKMLNSKDHTTLVAAALQLD
jgi:hypothetical protein